MGPPPMAPLGIVTSEAMKIRSQYSIFFPGRLLVAFALAAALGPAPVVSSAAPAADSEEVYLEIINSLMSPVCPGKILMACPSAEGAQLRELVRRKALAGESVEQITRYFVEVYGAGNVLPAPPAEGFFLTAWGLPFAGILAGLGVVFVLMRAWTANPASKEGESSREGKNSSPGASGDALSARLQRELDEFSSPNVNWTGFFLFRSWIQIWVSYLSSSMFTSE